MRKTLIHSIWLVWVLSVLSSSVLAGTLGNLTYEIADGQVGITGCKTSAQGELVIPDEIEGLPVTSIPTKNRRCGAFAHCSNLTSITIPESVTSIGNRAIAGCSSLASITIPESITSIENGTFYDCSSLTLITIPESVTSIGNKPIVG